MHDRLFVACESCSELDERRRKRARERRRRTAGGSRRALPERRQELTDRAFRQAQQPAPAAGEADRSCT